MDCSSCSSEWCMSKRSVTMFKSLIRLFKNKINKKIFTLTLPTENQVVSIASGVLPIEGTAKKAGTLRIRVNGVQHFQFPVEAGVIKPGLLIPPWMTSLLVYEFKFQFFLNMTDPLDTTMLPDIEIIRHLIADI